MQGVQRECDRMTAREDKLKADIQRHLDEKYIQQGHLNAALNERANLRVSYDELDKNFDQLKEKNMQITKEVELLREEIKDVNYQLKLAKSALAKNLDK